MLNKWGHFTMLICGLPTPDWRCLHCVVSENFVEEFNMLMNEFIGLGDKINCS